MRKDQSFITDIVYGLSARKKYISSDLHYDEEGSLLFDGIVRQPEYYVYRTEQYLLSRYAVDILDVISGLGRSGSMTLLELGASDARKAAYFFDAASKRLATYIPVNIEPSVLKQLEGKLALTLPYLEVKTLCADFLRPLPLPHLKDDTTLIIFFPGSTISQFDDTSAGKFFQQIRYLAEDYSACAFIVSSDACSDPARVLPAYDDDAGISAAFNLNILHHLNRLGEGTFDTAGFRHRVQWNAALGRVEMYLESVTDQICRFADQSLHFAAGELIQTGVSHKRTRDAFRTLAARNGWMSCDAWTDPEQLFDLHLLIPSPKS
jgi:L-histidine Nalpha-methyltransferase